MSPKSKAKRSRNSFVRGVRAESAISAYTRALGYVQTRPHAQAVQMIQERIAFFREELADVHRHRTFKEANDANQTRA